MKVLITGADGFIGRNLRLHLADRPDVQVATFTRANSLKDLSAKLQGVDFVFHLAGVNRPLDPKEFVAGNADLTRALSDAVCDLAKVTGKKVPVVYTSSTQATSANPYGESKRAAEDVLLAAARSHQLPTHIFRLPNVFGKWCKPDYNSAVATFCHNIARGLPIRVHDPAAAVTLVYVDDVVDRFFRLMDGADSDLTRDGFDAVMPEYTTTVGSLVSHIQAFRESRNTLMTSQVGTGLLRALYSTYVSYLPVESFAYALTQHTDPRGVFVEVLKTPDAGQFSFFTAHPGVTRGGHYHHTKTEKFLVIKGRARFKFRHMQTGQLHELVTEGGNPQIVETVPGWTHDITNIGDGEMIVMLWANEIFDRSRPDTYACAV